MPVATGLRPTSHIKPTTPSQPEPTPTEPRDVVLPTAVDSKQALDALLAAGGDLKLACELLGEGPGKALPQVALIKLLADKPALVQRHLRVFAMLNNYDLMQRAGKVLQTDIGSLETSELGKLYDRLSMQLDTFTKAQNTAANGSQTINVNLLLEQMPNEAASATKKLTQLSPEGREQMRRAIQAKRMMAPPEAEDADYETRTVS